MTFTATYSPEDNKLRLTASERLPKELYDRVKNASMEGDDASDDPAAYFATPEDTYELEEVKVHQVEVPTA